MNRRFRILLSGAFALLAVVVCAAYAGHVRDEAEQVRAEAIERYGGEVMSLVVANSELPRGHVVSRSDVTVRDWLLDLAPEGAETSLDDVVGLEVTNPVPAGSPLTALSFREESDVGPVPDGYVALSVPLGERLGMPGSAGSGERLAAWRVTESGAAPITGDLLLLSQAEGSGLSGSSSVVLAARPQDVAALLVASGDGSLRVLEPSDAAWAEIDAQMSAQAPASVPAEEGGAEVGAGSPGDGAEAQGAEGTDASGEGEKVEDEGSDGAEGGSAGSGGA